MLTSFCTFRSDYTSNLFKENKIDVLTKTMVKEVKEKTIVAQDEHKNLIESVMPPLFASGFLKCIDVDHPSTASHMVSSSGLPVTPLVPSSNL